jgi:hypothetical protein
MFLSMASYITEFVALQDAAYMNFPCMHIRSTCHAAKRLPLFLKVLFAVGAHTEVVDLC